MMRNADPNSRPISRSKTSVSENSSAKLNGRASMAPMSTSAMSSAMSTSIAWSSDPLGSSSSTPESSSTTMIPAGDSGTDRSVAPSRWERLSVSSPCVSGGSPARPARYASFT